MVIERVRDPNHPSTDDMLSDLNMTVRIGGRERTVEEFTELFGASGFALTIARDLLAVSNHRGRDELRRGVVPNAIHSVLDARQRFGRTRASRLASQTSVTTPRPSLSFGK